MLRAILRFLFGGADSTAAAGSPAPANSAETTAAAQKRVVAAILELRAVVKTGSAEEITAAIDAFKAKAVADDLEPRELADEVASAERMLTVLAYTDRLNRGEGMQAMAVMPDGEPAYFRATNVSRETARDDDLWGQLDVGDKGIFYDGAKRLTIVWGRVLTIGIDRESLIIHLTRGGTPHIFYLKSQREAHLAHAVASAIFKANKDRHKGHTAHTFCASGARAAGRTQFRRVGHRIGGRHLHESYRESRRAVSVSQATLACS